MNIQHEFFFHSQPRLQLFFESPNHCATILSMAGLVLSAVAVWTRTIVHSFSRQILLSIAFFSTVIALFGLALTYSRGGWFSFAIGFLVLIIMVNNGKVILIYLFGIFIMVLTLVPSGSQRTFSILEIENDPSIANRITVWKGALAMIADHWVHGVGEGKFGTQFSAWYQPILMKTSYIAALNNYFTLGAENGVFILWGYLVLLLVILGFSVHQAWRNQNILLLGISAAQISYLVSGLFTYSLTFWHVTGMFLFLYSILLGYLLMCLWNDPCAKIRFLQDTSSAILLSTFIVSLIYATGAYLSMKLPTATEPVIAQSRESSINGFLVRPKKGIEKGSIVYLHDNEENILEIGKTIMRPLAKRGYVVLAFSYPMDGIDGLRDSLELVNWSYSHLHLRKICLLGTGVGGRNAMLLACSNPMKQKISCVAAINASVDWPFPELAPMQQIKNLNVPLLAFIDSDCTDIVSGEMQIFEKACTAQKKHLEVQSFINADKTSYDKWFYIFQKLDAFFNSSL